MKGLVSVIIPAYNCRAFIAETIKSVVSQTYDQWEVIIVDDGSTDDLSKFIDGVIENDSRIRYIRQDNKGVSAARNHGFSKAKGDYVAFLDADDVWLPDNLKMKVQVLEDEGTGLVHSDGAVIDENSSPLGITLEGMEGDVLTPMLLWEGTQIPGPSSVMVRREVLETVGLFDEKLSTAADKDLFIRIAARYKVTRIAQVTWQYRVHNHNMHKNISVMESDMIAVYEKARKAGLFGTKAFERKCYTAMYLVLAASWAGDGRNRRRGFILLMKALRHNPFVIFNVLQRAANRFIRH